MHNDTRKRFNAKGFSKWLREYGLVVFVYLLATLFTNAYYMGDTADYVDSIVAYSNGRYYWFWEFGHLLLRPTGWALLVLLKPLTRLFVGDDLRANANLVLLALNWVAGLLSIVCLYGLISRFCERRWIRNVAVIAFIFSNGFLDYGQSGCAYIPALSLLILTFYILARGGDRPERSARTALAAGLALAGAVCFWFPFVLAVPAAVASPLFFYGPARWRWRLMLFTAVVAGLGIGLTYLSVMVGALGIYSVSGLRAWMAQTIGGPVEDRAVLRMLFGFPRSFINMGNDGLLFKRYLVHDPYTPVTSLDLFRASLWKIGLFYLFLASVTINLARSTPGRRVLGLLVLNGVPIIGLAVFWQGGDIERYFALYPLVFLSLAVSLCVDRPLALFKYISLAFVMAMILTNAPAMTKVLLDRKQEATAARARAILAVVKPNSKVFTVTFQDDLVNFERAFPFHPVNRLGYINPYAIIAPLTTQAPVWRQDFATKAKATWAQGGDVWVTRRVLSPRPRAEWNWVEGDDKSVSWNDIHSYFSQMEFGQTDGGEDGFALLLPSEKNHAFLNRFESEGNQSQPKT